MGTMELVMKDRMFKPFIDYLNSGRASKSNLLEIHGNLQAMLVEVERKIKEHVKQEDKLRSRIKFNKEEEWLD